MGIKNESILRQKTQTTINNNDDVSMNEQKIENTVVSSSWSEVVGTSKVLIAFGDGASISKT